MNRSVYVLLLLALWTSLSPRLVHAADASEVLIRKGVDKRRHGDDKGALPLFREAFDISRSARAAAQLGLCEQALEMWVEAEGHLSEALVSQTDAWVASKRTTLESSLKQIRSHMAQLTIANAPPSALVTLGGTPRGKPGDGPFYVLPGNVEVSIIGAGQRFETVERALNAGDSRTVTFANQAPVEPNAVSSASSEVPAPRPEESPMMATASIEADKPHHYGVYKWTALGVGTAALAVGTYALFARNSAASSFNDKQVEGQEICFRSGGKVVGPDGGSADESCNDLQSKVSTMTTLSAIGLAAGVSLVALGVVFWNLDKPSEPQSQALSCAPNLENVGMACAGRF